MSYEKQKAPTSRRAVLGAAASAGALAVATLGKPTPAMAAGGTAAAFAKPPTGSFDDSAIIKDASNYGQILGPGPYYLSGEGLDLSGFSLIGIPGRTTITIMGETGISCSDRLNQVYVDGIIFNGNSTTTKSVIRCTSTEPDVAYFKTFSNCLFRDFYGPALSFNQSDNPYTKIFNCKFAGANTATATGIAFADAADQCSILDCAFTDVVTGIFVGNTGNRTHIERCDFIHNEKVSYPRQDIHIQPLAQLANSGIDLTIMFNKFGNENRGPNDYFIVYADKGAAIYPGAKYAGEFFPQYSASNGYAGLQIIKDNDFSGATDVMKSPISSFTPNLIACQYGPNVHSGAVSQYEVEYMAAKPTFATMTKIDKGFSWGNNVAATNANSSYFRIAQ